MLVLSRKEGESLMIGDQISVTILSVDPGGQVTLGISAPKEVADPAQRAAEGG